MLNIIRFHTNTFLYIIYDITWYKSTTCNTGQNQHIKSHAVICVLVHNMGNVTKLIKYTLSTLFLHLQNKKTNTEYCPFLTRRMPLVQQKLLTLPEHLISLPFFLRFVLLNTLVFCVVFCRSLFVFLSRRGHDRMVVGFTTTCAISAYHH